MICPKCACEQPEAPECAKCGVLVARFRRRERAAGTAATRGTAEGAEGTGQGTRSGGGGAVLIPWLAIAATLLFFAGVWAMRRSGPGAEPGLSPPAPTESSETPVAVAAAALPEPTPPPSADPLAAFPPEPPPTAAAEVLPTATCPLSDHGYGAPPARGRVSSSWYTSASDFERARSEQDEAAALLVVYVYTDWCPYCREFEKELLSDSAVDAYLRDNVVKLRINPEQGAGDRALAQQLGASKYPTFLVALPGGGPEPLSVRAGKGRLKTPERFVDEIEAQARFAAESLLRAGVQERQAGRFPESITFLTRALKMRPQEVRTYLERGLSFAASGSTEDALDDVARAARELPGDLAPHEAVDEILGRQGRWDEVIACWTSFLERSPSSGRAYLDRSRALERRGLIGLSQADAERACRSGEPEGCRRSGRT